MNKIIDPLGDNLSSLELVRTGGSDLDVVNAARVSYGSRKDTVDERDAKLIHYLLKHHHTSPFEHTQLVFRVKAPIYVVRQWMRHRVGVSYNEISARYAVIPLEFYTPTQWRAQDETNKQGSFAKELSNDDDLHAAYQSTIDSACVSYQKLLDAGVCRELARGVLPVCTYTHFIFTCNLISLFHFVRLRADSHAQWEIQQYAKGMLEMAQESFPYSIASWKKIQGWEEVVATPATQTPVVTAE